jgi:hypothetical protein
VSVLATEAVTGNLIALYGVSSRKGRKEIQLLMKIEIRTNQVES